MTAPDRPPEDERTALARLYDLDLAEDQGDVELYLALAGRVDGPVLELGAGSGRLAVPLAAAGHEVTAVDLDAAMLERARAAAERAGPDTAARLRTVEADLVGLRLPEAGVYGFAFIGLNTLMALPARDQQREALRTLAAHVRRGGIVAVDVWQPDLDDLARFDGRLMLEWIRTDPETGEQVTKTGSARHDAPTQSLTVTAIFEASAPGGSPRRWIRMDHVRLVSADELGGMAVDAGLEIEVVAGGYDLEPLAPGAERAVLVARRP